MAFTILISSLVSIDLLCAVTHSTPANDPPIGALAHLRLDGNVGRWCEGACTKTYRAMFYEDTIMLEHLDVVDGMKTTDTINRRTGNRVFMWTGKPEMQRMVTYICETKPFSDFPVKKF